VTTKQDVATKAGVSERTVHRVINDPGLVDAETRARVEAVIEEMDYRPQHRGSLPSAVPLVHAVSGRVDERTQAELARRGEVFTAKYGPKTRGWDAALIRMALDWAINPPEGVAPMPDDYLGFVDRVTPV